MMAEIAVASLGRVTTGQCALGFIASAPGGICPGC
jgi:hypothetical protein